MRKLTVVLAVTTLGMISMASCKSHGSCPAYGNSSVKSAQPKAASEMVTKFTKANYKK
jgi:hypothetical protein